MIKFKTFIAEIKSIRDETHDTKTLVFDKPADIDFKPGQFFTMQFIGEDESPEKKIRSFSVASSPLDPVIDITVKREGEFSSRMCNAMPGTRFKFSGPFGNFVFSEDEKISHVMLSGGSGITPFRSFVKYAAQKNLKCEMIVIYSNKTPKDIIYRDELEEISAMHPNIRHLFTITRPDGTGWNGQTGRINKEMIVENVKDLQNAMFYTCGPKAMIDSVLDILKALEIKPENIRKERWN